MRRYFIRPRANFQGDFNPADPPMIPDICVSDHRPIDTGLVDQRGDRIMRMPEMVGFHRAGERG